MATEPGAPKNRIIIRDVPSYFSDGAMGAAQSGGVHRFTLGEFVFDLQPGATLPALQPVATISMTADGVRGLIKFLQEIPGIGENVG